MQSETKYNAGQGRKISEFNIGYMNALHNYGASADKIANHFDLASSTIYRLIALNFQYSEKSVRELRLDSAEKFVFFEAAKTNRDLAATDLNKEFRY
jgi:hypothetical protein